MNHLFAICRGAVIALVGALTALPVAAQLRCDGTHAKVIKLACEDKDVRRLMREVDAISKRRACSAEQAHELAVVLRLWSRRQFGCNSAPDAKACVTHELSAEVDYFRQVEKCGVDAHPMKFDGVDPSYVLAHPNVYAGTKTTIMGTMALASCDPESTSVAGSILEYKDERRTIGVEFKSMPDDERRFLCEKQPFSGWSGTVMTRPDGMPYLYATDVLGVELP